MSTPSTPTAASGQAASRRNEHILDIAEEYRLVDEDEEGDEDESATGESLPASFARFHEKQLMVLLSEGEGFLRRATDKIVKKFFSSHGHTVRRSLHFEYPRTKDVELHTILDARRAPHKALSSKDELLLIVNATHETHHQAQNLINFLWDQSGETFVLDAGKRLKEQRQWVLICATPSQLRGRPTDPGNDLLVDHIEVIRPTVERLYAKRAGREAVQPGRVQSAIDTIRAHPRIWGKTDQEVYRKLRYLKSADELERALEVNASSGAFQSIAQEKLRDRSPIKVAALYVATFMQDLPVADFDHAVTALLDGRTEREPVVVRSIQSGNDLQTITVHETRTSASMWTKARPRILAECDLRVSVDADTRLGGSRADQRIGFAHEGLRKAMEQALPESDPWIHVDSLEHLFKAGLLFSSGPLLQARIVHILIHLKGMDRDDFYERWLKPYLKHKLGSAKDHSNALHEAEREARFERLADILAKLIAAGEMDLVDRCIDWLRIVERYDDFIDLVRLLRDVDRFDELKWLFCLIENVSGDEPQQKPDAATNEKAAKPTSDGTPENGKVESESGGDNVGPPARDTSQRDGVAPGVGAANTPAAPGVAAANTPAAFGVAAVSAPAVADDGAEIDAAERYLRHQDVMSGHRAGIRRILFQLLEWTHDGHSETRRARFARRMLLEQLEIMAREAWEAEPQRPRSPILAALIEEVRVEGGLTLWEKYARIFVGHELDDETDTSLEAILDRFARTYITGKADDDLRAAVMAIRPFFSGRMLKVLSPAKASSLFVKLVNAFHPVVGAAGKELRERGEPHGVAVRQVYQTLHLVAWSLLLQGDQEAPAPVEDGEKLQRLLEVVVAAGDTVQQRRFLLFLSGLEQAVAGMLAELGTVARASSPAQHDIARARLLGVRRRIVGLRGSLDGLALARRATAQRRPEHA